MSSVTLTRVPTGDSAVDNGWSASTGTSKWAMVDDPVGTPNDDTDYVFASAANLNQLFTFDPITIPRGSVVVGVSVTFRVRRTATSVNANPRIRVGGTTYEGATAVPGSTYANRTVDWLTNPKTLLAWTADDINGVGSNALQEFGFANTQTTAGEDVRVTQAYLTVVYTEINNPARLVVQKPVTPVPVLNRANNFGRF